MANVIQVTPFMHVADLEAALDFFTSLGFGVDYRQPGYAYVSREGAGLRILAAPPGSPPPPGTRRFAYYFDCRDVDALHVEVRPVLDSMPAGDVHGPVDQPYGQRELLILAPDGNLVVFGQAAAR